MEKVHSAGLLLIVMEFLACLWESVYGADSSQDGDLSPLAVLSAVKDCTKDCQNQGCQRGKCQGEKREPCLCVQSQ